MTTDSKLPQPHNESELILAVGQWSLKNFEHRRAPELGIVEEIGEATHCVLKRIQGIRGFENEEFFKKEFGDALADIIIYLSDWCYTYNSFFKFGRNMHESVRRMNVDDQRKILRHLLQAADKALDIADRDTNERTFSATDESTFNMVAQRICNGCELWAQVYDLNLSFLVAATWEKISQRDWKKNPQGPEEHLK
jgi:NTP pyrophosphatase (non-canonical NTP hydrolase)